METMKAADTFFFADDLNVSEANEVNILFMDCLGLLID